MSKQMTLISQPGQAPTRPSSHFLEAAPSTRWPLRVLRAGSALQRRIQLRRHSAPRLAWVNPDSSPALTSAVIPPLPSQRLDEPWAQPEQGQSNGFSIEDALAALTPTVRRLRQRVQAVVPDFTMRHLHEAHFAPLGQERTDYPGPAVVP